MLRFRGETGTLGVFLVEGGTELMERDKIYYTEREGDFEINVDISILFETIDFIWKAIFIYLLGLMKWL